eukprot:TRINITY_DN838_c0_g1_i1.p1 TRINITY_DN838_c0_g1~~TRINITY_DN838_c0_g1_i1.p1  ORF type:complete len:239 (-),score=37.86 TRINITY_DN838_c0_g1_i1:18-710(-)
MLVARTSRVLRGAGTRGLKTWSAFDEYLFLQARHQHLPHGHGHGHGHGDAHANAAAVHDTHGHGNSGSLLMLDQHVDIKDQVQITPQGLPVNTDREWVQYSPRQYNGTDEIGFASHVPINYAETHFFGKGEFEVPLMDLPPIEKSWSECFEAILKIIGLAFILCANTEWFQNFFMIDIEMSKTWHNTYHEDNNYLLLGGDPNDELYMAEKQRQAAFERFGAEKYGKPQKH